MAIGYIICVSFTVVNVCSMLFSLKIFLKYGFLCKKLMFACGQFEENQL